MDNVVSIGPNVVRIDKSRDPIRTLEAVVWAFYSVMGVRPRFIILGKYHLRLLVRALRERGERVSEDTAVEILGLMIVRVPRDTLELGA